MNRALLGSKNHNWRTPERLLKLIRELAGGQIAFDPCTDDANPTHARNYCTPIPRDHESNPDGQYIGPNGLAIDGWNRCDGLTYANPPYGQALPAWAQKFREEGQSMITMANGARPSLLTLTPSRTDTAWFRHGLLHADSLCFLSWRPRFELPGEGVADSAPFPCVVGYWGPDVPQFRRVFAKEGWFRDKT